MPESYNICLDVGGTKVLGAIFNEKDEIIYRLKKRSVSGGNESADVEKVIIDVVEEMIRESGIDRSKLNAIASWNSFLWPMLATSSANVRTLPFGLYNFVTEGGARNEVMMAAATIVVLPMLILFLFARKYIVNGVARGGLKG